MNIPGLKTVRKLGRQWRGRLVAGGVVLGYHRVADLADDPYTLSVSPARFAAQMAFLRERMQPLPLPDLVDRALSGTLPPHAVAVTFDDGYADNLHQALPVLARYEIPATLFVTAGTLGGELWWDELARLVQCRPSAAWHEVAPELEGEGLPALYRWLLLLPAVEREVKLEELWRLAGGKRPGPVLMLTQSELQHAAASEWLEIGSHTVSHPLLNQLTPAEQMQEIFDSREMLEQMVGKPVRAFSYPNGRYTPHTIMLTQQAGYLLACTSDADVVWSRSDCFRLPRIWARNEPVPKFGDRWIEVGALPKSRAL
jgi:peptidoglycan/xylan/chitin deacetylase (PgdA/CDA1 family)